LEGLVSAKAANPELRIAAVTDSLRFLIGVTPTDTCVSERSMSD
jgi:hypothetical protein